MCFTRYQMKRVWSRVVRAASPDWKWLQDVLFLLLLGLNRHFGNHRQRNAFDLSRLENHDNGVSLYDYAPQERHWMLDASPIFLFDYQSTRGLRNRNFLRCRLGGFGRLFIAPGLDLSGYAAAGI